MKHAVNVTGVMQMLLQLDRIVEPDDEQGRMLHLLRGLIVNHVCVRLNVYRNVIVHGSGQGAVTVNHVNTHYRPLRVLNPLFPLTYSGACFQFTRSRLHAPDDDGLIPASSHLPRYS
jgi:hypothetical protein